MPISPGDSVGPYRVIPYAITHDHIDTALPLPTSINPNLSPEIERVLLKALAKDSSARYASATELTTALGQAAGIDAAQVATMSPPPTPIAQLVSPPPTVPAPLAPVPPLPVKSSPKLVAKPAPAPTQTAAAEKPARASRWKAAIPNGRRQSQHAARLERASAKAVERVGRQVRCDPCGRLCRAGLCQT